ncbi:hypothetical protein M501DRAFT_995463 [Patellaria atrata CBS 101060]|uniref:RING-type domain-containing protein n=1 Tax=Patellaria atrata CBS 101060 TaxID=1346257 RepID=A0A9P4S927_9PEZI|nr:hypothetical protein M501DRAFT_995463 [Patellaria atrata CBS 101060]
MSGYEVEHNIRPAQQSSKPSRLPDMSTFFTTLEYADTTGPRSPSNSHSIPIPDDIAALHRLFINALQVIAADHESGSSGLESSDETGHSALISRMIEELRIGADEPPRELKGVPDEFLAQLERVPKAKLDKDNDCPICGNPFLDDPYPLVVRLPCHKTHLVDLECITPWLKLNPTCPMDRKVIYEKKKPPPPADDDEDGEYDDMYA